jgi:hypothetical protein
MQECLEDASERLAAFVITLHTTILPPLKFSTSHLLIFSFRLFLLGSIAGPCQNRKPGYSSNRRMLAKL